MDSPTRRKSSRSSSSAGPATPRLDRREDRPVVLLTLDEDISEISALVEAAGFHIVDVVRQRRDRPDPSTFLGRGKVDDVAKLAADHTHPLASGGTPLAVTDAEVRPTVAFNLQDVVGIEVWDRVRLILEIFQRNARVKEAQLQVELARMRYELPYVHEALHRRLKGQRAGYMGGGEVEIRTYETHLKRRTKTILHELERVRKERRTRRIGRRKGGSRLVAIAGYTNSGKSSLLNSLTGSDVPAEQRVFTTLQTSTKRVLAKYSSHSPQDIIFTDTVGFIRNLPPWLIDAFQSTLEEITEADAVLLVVDASETIEIFEEKITTAFQILEQIHAPRRRAIVLNKADLVPSNHRQRLETVVADYILPADAPCLFVSTLTTEGLHDLVQTLRLAVFELRTGTVILNLFESSHARLESWLHDHTEIIGTHTTDGKKILHIRCAQPAWNQLLRETRASGAILHVTPSTGNKGGPPSR